MSKESSKTAQKVAPAKVKKAVKPTSSVPAAAIEPVTTPRPDNQITWGPGWAIGLSLFIYIAVQIVGSIIIEIWPKLHHWDEATTTAWLNNSVFGQFAYVVIVEGLSLLVLNWFLHRRKSSLTAIGLVRPKWKDILYSLSGFGVYFVSFVIIVDVLSKAVPSFNANQTQNVGFQGASGLLNLTVVFVSLVVLPPLVEEILFRGFMFSGLKRAMPVFWAGILTSLLFAAPHLLEAQSGGALWVAGVDTFILSLVLVYLRQKTGSLWASIGLHALKNGLAFATLYLIH